MELLRIKHHDFVMTIECTKFDAIWDKAKRNVGEDKLSSLKSATIIQYTIKGRFMSR